MVKVYFPRQLRDLVGVPADAESNGATLAELFAQLEARWPGVRACILDEHGDVRPHVSLFVNGTGTREPSTVLHPGDELFIIPAVSGG